jgi:hypothetical protein
MTIRILLGTALAVLLCGSLSCRRSISEEERGISELQATHPWELPAGRDAYISDSVRSRQNTDIPPDGKVEKVPARGPQFSETDTLDVGKLAGSWVMVGIVANERMSLRSNSDYSTLVLQQNSSYKLFDYNDNELSATLSGEWRKTKPGVIGLFASGQSGHADSREVHSELFAEDFFYMWDYSGHWGNWFVRQTRDEPEVMIGYNRYNSNLGHIVLTNVGKASYSGEMTTEEGHVWQLSGYLVDGILNMAWTDVYNNASGFAAFIVEDNWDRLRGAYWKNDYEARPFSAEWLAEADR